MHEEWEDTRRTATTEVQLTDAPPIFVAKENNLAGAWKIEYRPYRIEVSSSWPGSKIGNGHTSVRIHANERYWNGALSPLKVTLLLSDLNEVHQWLVDLVRAAEARNFG